jgi:hypothetical protein
MARHDSISDSAPRPTRTISTSGLHDTPQPWPKFRGLRHKKRTAGFGRFSSIAINAAANGFIRALTKKYLVGWIAALSPCSQVGSAFVDLRAASTSNNSLVSQENRGLT